MFDEEEIDDEFEEEEFDEEFDPMQELDLENNYYFEDDGDDANNII